MAEAKLSYFDGRGLGERVRMMLCFAGVKFEDVFLTERAQMEKLINDGDLMFGQVPLLEIDGLKLVQLNACVYYLASRSGMNSSDPKIQARINMLYEGTRDFYMTFIPAVVKFTDEQIKEAVLGKAAPRYLPIFEKALKENGTGYLVGDKVTIADVGLLEDLLAFLDYVGEEHLKDYPNLKKFIEKMKSLDATKLYLEKYRKRKNDERYKVEVLKVLAWDKFNF